LQFPPNGYNQAVIRLRISITAGLLFLTACSRGPETKDAVRQAVIDHLAKRSGINVSSMQIDVTSVSFRGNEADAAVSFRPKGGEAGQAMTMNYTLEKKGGAWVVKARSDAGGMPHGGMGGATGQAPGAPMPSGHPPVGEAKPPGSPK
jgi:hypothetical protein